MNPLQKLGPGGQATGGIGTSLPSAGNRVIQVGKAENATDLFVDIIDYGKKAA